MGGTVVHICHSKEAEIGARARKFAWSLLNGKNLDWWHMPVIPAINPSLKWDNCTPGRLEQKVRSYLQIITSMAQAEECKCEALIQTPEHQIKGRII
jgi:hypothetical protein